MKKLFIIPILLLAFSCTDTFENAYFGDIIIDSEEDLQILQYFSEGGYSSIVGNLIIEDVANINFGLLQNLEAVDGDLGIVNRNLLSLEFLKNLRIIKGNFTISGTKVNDLSPIYKIDEVGKTFNITYNRELISIDGFNSLKTFTSLNIISNNLESLSGFNNVETNPVAIEITITDEDLLPSIAGFNKITKIKQLHLRSLPSGLDIFAFESVDSIGYLDVRGTYNFNWHTQTQLKYIKNLDISTTYIISSESPMTIDTLWRVGIIQCDSLTNLDFLSNTQFFNEIFIRDNYLLEDFCGISYISDSIGYFLVHNNLYNPTWDEIVNGSCKISN